MQVYMGIEVLYEKILLLILLLYLLLYNEFRDRVKYLN